MGCSPPKEAALAVHPGSDAGAPASPTKSTAAGTPASASTIKSAMLRNSAPSSAHPHAAAEPRADSGMARHSAGSSEGRLAGSLGKLPQIPKSAGSVVRGGGLGSDAPTAFEIPLDDAVKVRARKPTSANPAARARRRTQLAPMPQVSNEELQKKLAAAAAMWEDESSTQPAMDKDLDPAVLRALMADREHRIAMNRLRELEEKKAKLMQHEAHARAVAERKSKIAAAQQAAAPAGQARSPKGSAKMPAKSHGRDSADLLAEEVPAVRMSWDTLGGGRAPAAVAAARI